MPYSKTGLYQQIVTKFANAPTGNITAQELREVSSGIVDLMSTGITIGDFIHGGTSQRVLFIDGTGLGQNANFVFNTGTQRAEVRISLPAGQSGVGLSPIRFAPGINLLTPETGALEFDGANLCFTPNDLVRRCIAYTGTDIKLFTGILPISRGGTNAITATAAINNLLPSQSGNAGKVLLTDGTNTSWVNVTGASGIFVPNILAIGDTVSGSIGGSVLFISGTQLGQDNANFFWDNANKRLGILRNGSADSTLDIGGLITGRSGIVIHGTGSFSQDVTLHNRAGITFKETSASGNNSISLRAPLSLAGNLILVLPENDGIVGGVLATDGNGNLYWASTGSHTIPGGSNRFVQFNDNGAFSGNAGFQYTSTSGLTVSNSGSFGNSVTINNNASLVFASGGKTLTLSRPTNISTSFTLTLPDNDGNNGEVLVTDGNGVLSWRSSGSNPTPGGIDRAIQFNDNGALGGVNGFLFTSNQGIVVPSTGSFGGALSVGSNIRILNNSGLILTDNSTNTISIVAPTSVTTYRLTLPDNDGTAGFVLSTDGNGATSWKPTGATPPAGSNRQVQFNDNGVFGAVGGFTLTSNTGLVVGGSGSFGEDVILNNGGCLVFKELAASGNNSITICAPLHVIGGYTLTLPQDGGIGQVLAYDGNGNTYWTNTGTAPLPGGINRNIQFNDNNSFGGTNGFTLTTSTGLVVQGSGTFGNSLTLYNRSALRLTDSDDSFITVIAHPTSTAYTLTLPSDAGTNGFVLRTDGNGNTTWAPTGTVNGVAGSNRQIQFNDNGSFGTSAGFVFTSSSGLEVARSGSFGGTVTIYSNSGLRLFDNSTNSILIKAPTSLTSYTFVLPNTDGSQGQVLVTDGNGNTSWISTGNNPIPGGTDRNVQFNDNGTLGGVNGFQFTSNQGLVVPTSGHFGTRLSVGSDTIIGGNLSILNNSGLILSDNSSSRITIVAPTSVTTYTLTLPLNGGTNGYVLTTNGAGATSWRPTGNPPPVTPQGDNREIQFNNNGAFGASPGLVYTLTSGLVVGNSGSFSGDLTLHNQRGIIFKELASNGGLGVTLRAPSNLTSSITLTLPDNDGNSNQVLITDGNGNLSWASTGVTVGPAGSNRQIQFNNSSAFGASAGFELSTATGLIVAGSGAFGGAITTFSHMGGLILRENSALGASFVSFIAPTSLASTYTFTLPSDGGSNGFVLVTDGNGTTSWRSSGLNPTPGGSDRQVQYNNGGVLGGDSSLVYSAQSALVVGGSGSFGADVVMRNWAGIRLHEPSSNGQQYVGLYAPASLTASYNLLLPNTDGNSGDVLVTDGVGNLRWSPSGTSTTTPPAGSNREIQFNNAGSFGATSSFHLTTNNGLVVGGSGSFAGDLVIRNANNIALGDADSSHHIFMRAPSSLGNNLILVLPNNDGSVGSVLRTDGNGNLSWASTGSHSTPGASDRAIQFNNNGAFGGDNTFRFTSAGGLVVPGSGSFDDDLHCRHWHGVRLYEHNAFGSEYVGLYAPISLAASYNLLFPTTNGNVGEVLVTDGAGNLTWAPSGGGSSTPGGINRTVQFNDNGSFNGVNGFLFTSNQGLVVPGSGYFGTSAQIGSTLSVGSNLTIRNNAGLVLTDLFANTVTLALPSSVTSYTLTLPDNDGSNGQVLTTNGFGTTTWSTVSSSTSPGGSNTSIQFNNGGSFGGDSNFRYANNGLIVGGSGSFDDDLNCRNWHGVRLYELSSNGSQYVGLYSPSTLTASYDLIFPSTNGNAGEVLVTDGNGNLSWAPSGAGGGGGGAAGMSVLSTNFTTVSAPSSTIGSIRSHFMSSSDWGVNDYLKVKVWGTVVATSSNKTFQLSFGGTSLFSFSTASTSMGDWNMEAIIARSATSSQKATIVFSHNTATIVETSLASVSNSQGFVDFRGAADNTNEYFVDGFIVEWYDG